MGRLNGAAFTEGLIGTALAVHRMGEDSKRNKQEAELRDLQVQDLKEKRDIDRKMRDELQAASRSQGAVQGQTVDAGQGKNFYADPAQAQQAAADAQAEAEMRGGTVQTAPAVGGGNQVFQDPNAAARAGFGNDTQADVLQRQSQVYSKFANPEMAMKLGAEAKRLRDEGAMDALRIALSTGDPNKTAEAFNATGKDRITDVRIVSDPAQKDFAGNPKVRIYGKVNGAAEESDLLRGTDAVSAYMMLKGGPEMLMGAQLVQRKDARDQATLDNTTRKTDADIALGKEHGSYYKALAENVPQNLKLDARRVAVAERGAAVSEAELAMRQDKAQKDTFEGKAAELEKFLGVKLTPEQKMTMAGFAKSDEGIDKWAREVAAEVAKSDPAKADQAAQIAVKLGNQYRAASQWTAQEPQVRSILGQAAEKGELGDAITELRKKYPGLSDEWIKANGFDPKNTDLKSYKSSAYLPIESAVEKKLGITPGILANLRLNGEKSNADQVSSANAKSVYQITPSNAEAYAKSHGLDISKPADAAMVAGLLVQERERFYKDLPPEQRKAKVIRSYHGGYEEKDWGSVNRAYAQRTGVASPAPGKSAADMQARAAPFEAAENEAQASFDAAQSELSKWGGRQQARDPAGYKEAKAAYDKARKALEAAQAKTRKALEG